MRGVEAAQRFAGWLWIASLFTRLANAARVRAIRPEIASDPNLSYYAGMQVFSTGQTSAHFGVSKWPSHSVHFFGSMIYMSFLSLIAAFGHSNSQAPQTVHCDATIL
jgi:hypothetical protein